MLLNSLEMRNFKKYREAKLDFQDGLTGIVGMNGSGKSTIVEAVAWSLYGNRASIIKRDFIKNVRAGDGQDVEVKLSLNLGSQELTVVRAMRKKSLMPDARLYIDKMLVASGSKEVDLQLGDILKISFQDFMKTFYARQKDLDNLLKEGGAKKREYLLTLLGLDEIREGALDLIRSDSRELMDLKNRLDGGLSEIGDVEGVIESLKREFSLQETRLSQAEAAELSLTSTVDAKRKIVEREMDRKRSHQDLVNQIERLNADLSQRLVQIERYEKRLEEIEKGKWQLYELKSKLSRLNEVNCAIDAQEPKRKRHQELIQDQIKYETELKEKNLTLKDKTDQLEILNEFKKELLSIVPQETERKDLLERLNDLEDKRELHRDLHGSLYKENARLDALQNSIVQMESYVEELKRTKVILNELEPLKDRYEEVQIELVRLKAEEEKQRFLDDLENRLGDVGHKIGNLLVTKSNLEKDIADLGDVSAEERKLKSRKVEIRDLEFELNKKLNRLKPLLEVQRAQLSGAKKQLSQMEMLGEESNCPTCERRLGDQYFKLVEKYHRSSDEALECIENFEDQIRKLEEKLDFVTESKKELEDHFKLLASKVNRLGELRVELRGVNARIIEQKESAERLEGEVAKLGPSDYDLQKVLDLEAEMGTLQVSVRKHAELQIKVMELPRKLSELKTSQERREAICESVKRLKGQISDLDFDEDLYVQKKNRVSELDPIHERFSALNNRVKDIPLLEDDVKRVKTDLLMLKDAVNSLKEEINGLGFDPFEFERLLKEQKDLRKAEEIANQIKQILATEDDIRLHLDEVKEVVIRTENDLQKVTKRIFELNYEEERLLSANSSLEDAHSQLESARKGVSKIRVDVGILKGDLERAKSDLLRKKEILEEIFAAEKQLQVVDTARTLINRFMDHILVRIRNEIAINAGQIMWDVTGKYSRLSIDEDFNILVEDGGEYFPISRYSGGEIDMIAVSVRVAISEYLMRFSQNGPGYSFLILDEIFGSQDVVHRESMISMLRNLEDRFPQIFVISHISEVQGQFDNTIMVIEDEDGSSQVEVDLV